MSDRKNLPFEVVRALCHITAHDEPTTVALAHALGKADASCEGALCELYEKWCRSHDLPCMSADELEREPCTTQEHRNWLGEFLIVWGYTNDAAHVAPNCITARALIDGSWCVIELDRASVERAAKGLTTEPRPVALLATLRKVTP